MHELICSPKFFDCSVLSSYLLPLRKLKKQQLLLMQLSFFLLFHYIPFIFYLSSKMLKRPTIFTLNLPYIYYDLIIYFSSVILFHYDPNITTSLYG